MPTWSTAQNSVSTTGESASKYHCYWTWDCGYSQDEEQKCKGPGGDGHCLQQETVGITLLCTEGQCENPVEVAGGAVTVSVSVPMEKGP